MEAALTWKTCTFGLTKKLPCLDSFIYKKLLNDTAIFGCFSIPNEQWRSMLLNLVKALDSSYADNVLKFRPDILRTHLIVGKQQGVASSTHLTFVFRI